MASVSPLIYCSLYAGSMRTNQPPPTGRHVVPDDRKERNASSVPRCGLSSGPSAAFASALGRDLFRYRAGPAPRMIHTSTSSISARYSSSLLPPVQAVLVDASDNGKGLSAACDALKVFVIERERERERERGGGGGERNSSLPPYLWEVSLFSSAENLFEIRCSGGILYVFRAMALTRAVSCHEFPLVKELHKILRNSFSRPFVIRSGDRSIFIIRWLLDVKECRSVVWHIKRFPISIIPIKRTRTRTPRVTFTLSAGRPSVLLAF
jgi:hypothetical protein